MKNVLTHIYSLIFRLVHICSSQLTISNSLIWLLKVRCDKACQFIVEDSQIKRSTILIHGHDNRVQVHGAKMDNCEIRVNGSANTISIDALCAIHNTIIVVTGNNCRITIGKETTVGSMYMVCMGQKNFILIGEDCMIADNVDIWATDSHPIFNEKGKICNQSKPVKIGNHVWVGKSAKILKGVTINDNAIVGMDALVTKDVPANSLVVGNDVRILKSDINWNRSFIPV